MAYEQKENAGSLFRNQEKKTEKHPDYTGTINIGGDLKRLSAWLKESKNGVKYLSLSVSEMKAAPRSKTREPIDDEIPF